MLVTFDQIICHFIGDFFLQSDWMASNKYAKFWVALLHARFYTLPFLFLTQSIPALWFICVSHALYDHYKVANYIAWAKNFIAPKWIELYHEGWVCHKCHRSMLIDASKVEHKVTCPGCGSDNTEQTESTAYMARNYPWKECTLTGSSPQRPIWLTCWLGIIIDNCCHIILNAVAIKYF